MAECSLRDRAGYGWVVPPDRGVWTRRAAVWGARCGSRADRKGGLWVIPLARADPKRGKQTGGGASKEKKLHRSVVT
ncbi:hypothetical protein GCM10029963_74100 [Micromonospora andamanensis]|nr:hypothetical protein Vwe01_26630 [Micromonospora andamanensis]